MCVEKYLLFVFDKTGTLTEDGLDIYGVRPVVLDTVRNEVKKLIIRIKSY